VLAVGCGGGPDPNADYERDHSIDRRIPVHAAVVDECERACRKSTGHSRRRCGDSTCDEHVHRAGDWTIVRPDLAEEIREEVESAAVTFLADLKPEIRSEFKDNPEPIIAEVRALVLAEARRQIPAAIEGVRTRTLGALRSAPRDSEAGCNTSAQYSWSAVAEVDLTVKAQLRLTGPRGKPTIAATVTVEVEVEVELGEPAVKIAGRNECPCKAD